jgi:hypothetical protein
MNLPHVGGKTTGNATTRSSPKCTLGKESATRKPVLRRNAQSGSWSIRHSQVLQIESSSQNSIGKQEQGGTSRGDDNRRMTGFGSRNSLLCAGLTTQPCLCIRDDLHDSYLGKDVPARVSLLLRFS